MDNLKLIKTEMTNGKLVHTYQDGEGLTYEATETVPDWHPVKVEPD